MNKELLRMENVDTYFSSKKVLDAARLNLFEGEVIGITGVNNSGKTALAGGAAGLFPIHQGRIYISEKQVSITSIPEARNAGVYYFSRSSSLISDFTIWQNFLLGPDSGQVLIKKNVSEIQCEDMLELLGIHVNIHEQIHALSLKEKLLVEIARAVYYEAKILIMDDVLSTLSATALEEMHILFQMLCTLHIGILLIDTSIRHLKPYCDRLFVMRDGHTVAVLNCDEMDDNLIINLMLGKKTAAVNSVHTTQETYANHDVLLKLDGICFQNVLQNLSFQVFREEITGILNVGKHSGNALNQLLQGRGQPDCGTIFFDGCPLVFKSIEHAVTTGISSLSKQNTVIPNLTLEENIMLPALKQNGGIAGFLHRSELKYHASELLSRYIFSYKGISISEPVIQQDRVLKWKLSFCRMLSTSPKLVLLQNPTTSIDITTKELLYEDIRSLVPAGITPLIISSDLKELFALCDKIIVISQGRTEAAVPNDVDGQEELLYLYGQYLKLS